MKNHYKGEFNMAALLRSKPPADDSDDEGKWKLIAKVNLKRVES